MTTSAAPAAMSATDARVLAAWDANAAAWTRALREGRLPGRAAADEAILRLVRQVPTGPILDAGCGEGWLARELAGHRHEVMAVDGSTEMLVRAEEARGVRFRRLTYAEAAEHPRRLEGPFGTIVFNFSLPGEKITPILETAGEVLFPYGRILIQAPHPTESSDEPYADEWREERFAETGIDFPRPQPFYFRTLATWIAELRRARLILTEVLEPVDPETGRPVSLILSATTPERWK
ncbi:MAG TPA: methyltransferase domain-containing protein [Longimicrobium sp.]|nr:methyltransferase domain-containing protein [Longimicrobium sp.]